MNTVTSLMKSFKMRPYNEDTGYGFLRHILVRTGYHTGQIMVVLVPHLRYSHQRIILSKRLEKNIRKLRQSWQM